MILHFALTLFGCLVSLIAGEPISESSERSLKGSKQPPTLYAPFRVALWANMPFMGQTTGVFEQTNGTNYFEQSPDNPGEDYKKVRDCINGQAGNLCGTTQPPAFAWFGGDMFSGFAPCTEKYYDRFEGLANSLLIPSLQILGDNDWIDCHKTKTGEPRDPLLQLNYLKKRFFREDGMSYLGLGHIQTTNGGADHPDFQRWTYNGVMFVGIPVVTSNNGLYDNLPNGFPYANSLQAFDPGCVRAMAEFYERTSKVNAFLRDAFAQAKTDKLSGVMVMIQVNMWWQTKNCTDNFTISTGYQSFYDTLFTETLAFPGKVALIHTQSHLFMVCGDVPQTRRNLPPYGYVNNFVEVQIPGSINVGWVEASVNASSSNVFSFKNYYLSPPPYYDP